MSNTTYRVDPIHSGIRLAVLTIMLIGVGLGIMVIMPALANLLGLTELPRLLLTVPGGIAFGIGLGWIAERGLRAAWPSGRWLKVGTEDITLQERSGEMVSLKWANRINVLSWHFVVRGGRSWVPKGWYCVACRLTQDDRMIAPYAFVKPTDAQAMAQWHAFPELISRKHAPKAGKDYQLRQIGEQGPLRAAEKDRWSDGAEMQPDDFAALVAEIDRRLPDWPPKAHA